MEQYMIYIWLVLIVLFTCIEAATVNIVTIWFAVGSIAAVVVNILGGGLNAQLIMFLTVSVASLILLKPIVTKLLKSNHTEKFNTDALIGSIGNVTECIGSDSIGEVEVTSKKWRAKTENSDIINVGEKVMIVSIKGVTLSVKKVEEE